MLARLGNNPNVVLTFAEWCIVNSLGARTGRKILADEPGYGPPPIVTKLSPRRHGITIGNNAAWQQSRERTAS